MKSCHESYLCIIISWDNRLQSPSSKVFWDLEVYNGCLGVTITDMEIPDLFTLLPVGSLSGELAGRTMQKLCVLALPKTTWQRHKAQGHPQAPLPCPDWTPDPRQCLFPQYMDMGSAEHSPTPRD